MGSVSTLTHLECSLCSRRYSSGEPQTVCECGSPLLARYELEEARRRWSKESLRDAPPSMWRYAPLLPVESTTSIITLGEGFTPLLHARRAGARLGLSDLWIKDEALNPTGSFKARGLSCAISKCKEFGIEKVAIPSAGNAASAAAAYSAAAGIEARIFMPADVPQSNFIECAALGANVTLVGGLISDCARLVAARKAAENWFELTTLREPYRIEGKKTMGFEIAEQLSWQLPGAILYPAGGGVGLIGIWKAFEELERIGWIGPQRPKMIAVQAAGCQPLVRAFENGAPASEFFENAHTVASGLRVPKPLGDVLMLDAIRTSGGAAVAVTDRAMIDAGLRFGADEGIFLAPEGAACVAALEHLLASGKLNPDERIVLLNTGSGLKYLEAYSVRFQRSTPGDADKLGGLITPR